MRAGPRLVLIQGDPPPPAAPATVDAIFRRYAPYVARVALRLLGRREEVEDVVQDVFVQAIKGLERVRDPEAVKGWLSAVTTRVVSKRIKRHRLKRLFGLEEAPDHESIIAPGATAEQRALLTKVYDVLGTVDVDARAAWILRYVEGERLEMVAASCGCSLATAKRRIAAAQRRLDGALGESSARATNDGDDDEA